MRITLVVLLVVVLLGGGYVWHLKAHGDWVEARAAEQARQSKRLVKDAEDRAATAMRELRRLEQYGNSDPRNLSAVLAKTVSDREVEVSFQVILSNRFKFPKKLPAKATFPEGRREEETKTYPRKGPLRKGLLLGRRSHSVFCVFMVAKDELEPCFQVEPVRSIHVKTVDEWFERDHPYDLVGTEAVVQTRIAAFHESRLRPCVIVHAWKTPEFAVFVGGYECSNAPGATPDAQNVDLDLLPYKGEKNWLGVLDKPQTNLFPVSTLNGCVALINPELGPDFDHRGLDRSWEGFALSISTLFMPDDRRYLKPVIHSLIYQIDSKRALWMPYWGEKKHLDAVNSVLDLNDYFSVRFEYNGTNRPVKISDSDANDGVKRHGLLEAFRSLMKSAAEF